MIFRVESAVCVDVVDGEEQVLVKEGDSDDGQTLIYGR